MKRFLITAAVLLLLCPLLGLSVIYLADEAYDRGHYKSAFWVIKPLAALGVDDYQARLGKMYATGRGVPHDPIEAVKWLRNPAENGDPFAQAILALLYFSGDGVKEDRAKYFELIVKSAQQDYRPAQMFLADTYSRGDAKAGVAQDKIEAYKWFLLGTGIMKIPKSAADNAKSLTEGMTPADISKAEQLAKDWIATHRKKR